MCRLGAIAYQLYLPIIWQQVCLLDEPVNRIATSPGNSYTTESKGFINYSGRAIDFGKSLLSIQIVLDHCHMFHICVDNFLHWGFSALQIMKPGIWLKCRMALYHKTYNFMLISWKLDSDTFGQSGISFYTHVRVLFIILWQFWGVITFIFRQQK